MTQHPILQDGADWLVFGPARGSFTATALSEVVPCLSAVVEEVDRGRWAVGYLAYEAAPAFDPALVTHERCPLPLAAFTLHDPPRRNLALPGDDLPFELGQPTPSLTADEYRLGVARIHRWLAAGDTYQVNYTHRLALPFTGDAYSLARRLWTAQRGAYGAYLPLGEQTIVSASPELFCRLEGQLLTSRPMKGTRPRGLTADDDQRLATELRESPKDQAENLMIVDMLRNDLGRLARPGTVAVPRLFEVEQYETVWQMTSTVTAETSAGPLEVLGALFPCASITGAPKIRTMQLIRALEPSPRGVYTGAIGYLAPGRMQLSVAIRTLVLNHRTGLAEYGVGGGIVADSTADNEWRECADKARVLQRHDAPFELLETLLYEPGAGWLVLDEHLQRLASSAAYFAYRCDLDKVRRRLDQAVAGRTTPQRVRLLLARDGTVTVELFDAPAPPSQPWRVTLAPSPIAPDDRFLYHKTTRRVVYEAARAACPEVADVLLFNPAGELTESTIANVVVELGGVRYTPPVSCGLLPGTFRARLLAEGVIQERVIRVEQLAGADQIWLINSVRRWVPVELVR